MTVRIKDTDKGFRNFRKALEEIDGKRADVGYWGRAMHKDSGMSVAQLATIHEYGTEPTEGHAGIPARPFLRTSADSAGDVIYPHALKVARQVIAGNRNGLSLLRLVANRLRKHIRDTMDNSPSWATPLAAITKRRRKQRGLPTSPPLVATRELRSKVRMRIRGGEDG